MMMASPLSVLLVEDDPDLRAALELTLSETEHTVTSATDGAEALALLSSTVFDVMVCDIRLPHVDGMTLFRSVGKSSPSTNVILMSAQAQVSEAVAAVKEGAFDYLAKPFDRAHLLHKLAQLAERRRLLQELANARNQLAAQPTAEIVGASPSLQRLHAMIDTLAQSAAPVVIT